MINSMKSNSSTRVAFFVLLLCVLALPFAIGQQKEADPGASPAPPKKAPDAQNDLVSSTNSDEDIRELKLKDWKPTPMLKVKQTFVNRPAFPAIDVHNHLGGGAKRLTDEVVKKYLEVMDAAGVQTVVNLDGMW